MATGTVRWFKPERGYGFIEPDTDDDLVFVHKSAVTDEGRWRLADGQRVSYTTNVSPGGGFEAADVRFLDEAAVELPDGETASRI